MESFLTIVVPIIVYLLQILILGLVAAIFPALLYKKWKKKKILCLLFCCIFALELFGVSALAQHPILLCPKEYREYISEADEERITGFNSGRYSEIVPVIPVCIEVQYADSDAVFVVATYYMPFGRTVMEITPDGPGYLSALRR